MDDICTGADTIEDAQILQYELIYLLNQFCLDLKKWTTNSLELMGNIPSEDKAVGPLPFDDDKSPYFRVLGLKYNSKEDFFNYNVSSTEFVFSKRSILSIILDSCLQ